MCFKLNYLDGDFEYQGWEFSSYEDAVDFRKFIYEKADKLGNICSIEIIKCLNEENL